VEVHPLAWEHPDQLTASLAGAEVLYNTYWVRYNAAGFNHGTAVANTLKLFAAAQEAGVRRVVHVSITNPSERSPLEYFRGKARLERWLLESSLSCAILRPAVMFGTGDVLVNNIAWALRRFPVFAVFGRGEYRLQPIHVDDLAALAVEQGKLRENRIIDAIGPQTFTYRQLVRALGQILGRPRPIVSVPAWLGYWVLCAIGRRMGDVVLTREEIDGLKQNLLCTRSAPAGRTMLTEWAQAHADTLGVRYASELARRQNRRAAYDRI
jgi:NADH dehydrogenase